MSFSSAKFVTNHLLAPEHLYYPHYLEPSSELCSVTIVTLITVSLILDWRKSGVVVEGENRFWKPIKTELSISVIVAVKRHSETEHRLRTRRLRVIERAGA
ncbi:hypothetical protein Tco_1541663 [Tanacetum coccineum]